MRCRRWRTSAGRTGARGRGAWPISASGTSRGGAAATCGPRYYADEYRRYNTFIKDYDRAKPVYRIAAGANSSDTNWTDVLMTMVGRRMNGLSLHYYTLPTGNWGKKGSATAFDEAAWFATLSRTLVMDERIARHDAIMNKTDPQKRISLIVDEWGTWYDVEPGTEPGFLFQQNTLRDAVVAALNFHIFHKHADRVAMANIAQTVNVLQAMILTDKEKMLRTPTYWVFEMFKVHQGGTFLPIDVTSPDYALGNDRIPALSASATRAADGKAVHLSVVSTSPRQPITLTVALSGIAPTGATGRVLTAAAMQAHNTFSAPDTVRPVALQGLMLAGGALQIRVPPMSVVIVELR